MLRARMLSTSLDKEGQNPEKDNQLLDQAPDREKDAQHGQTEITQPTR